MNALEHENVWQVMYQRSLDFARRGIFTAGLSAIDIALWDIKGKHFNLPVCTLLGGAKTKVIKPYATGLLFTHGEGPLVNRLVATAKAYKEQGMRALKMSVGLGKFTFSEKKYSCF